MKLVYSRFKVVKLCGCWGRTKLQLPLSGLLGEETPRCAELSLGAANSLCHLIPNSIPNPFPVSPPFSEAPGPGFPFNMLLLLKKKKKRKENLPLPRKGKYVTEPLFHGTLLFAPLPGVRRVPLQN